MKSLVIPASKSSHVCNKEKEWKPKQILNTYSFNVFSFVVYDSINSQFFQKLGLMLTSTSSNHSISS